MEGTMSASLPDHTPTRHDQLAIHQDRSHAGSPTIRAVFCTSPRTHSTALSSLPSTPIPPATTVATSPKSVRAAQPCSSVFDLDDPRLPLHAAQRPTNELAGELVCRFRAIHTPLHLFRPIDWGVFGEVIVDTPSHLHINVKFEHLHMMNAIKQAWVNTHIKPNTECMLRLGEPVFDEAREVHIQKKSQDLVEALFPSEGAVEAVTDEFLSSCRGRSPSVASAGPIPVVQASGCESATRLSERKPLAEQVRSPNMISVGTQTEGVGNFLPGVRTPQSTAKKAKRAKKAKSLESVAPPNPPGPTPTASQASKVKAATSQKSWAQIVSRH